jgi:hypothetical protein
MCPALRIDANTDVLSTLHAGVLRWCVDHAVRKADPVALTALAMYHEPRSSFLSALLSEHLLSLFC